MYLPLYSAPLRACLVCAASVLYWAMDASGQNDFLQLTSFGNAAASAATPWCVPVLGSDGVLYGTSSEGGGTDDAGTVFKVNQDGSGFALLHRFLGGADDGKNPRGGLIEGNDGALYGTICYGGSSSRLR